MITDDFDDDWHLAAIIAADAAQRLLNRSQTQKVIHAGMLDDDAVEELQMRLREFQDARQRRISDARTS